MYKKIMKIDNGMEIESNLCVCLPCNICIKSIGVDLNKTLNNGRLSISHSKVYDLISQYGIERTSDNSFMIETPELRYYVLNR